MATCEHCGTAFSPTHKNDQYCCHGCEYVAEMIRESGFDRFYDLKQGLATAPVRSRPFERHDFSWLEPAIKSAEANDGRAELDCAVEGVSCVGCVWLIEKLFGQHPGAIRAVAHPASGRLHLEWQSGQCDLQAFFDSLTKFGYVVAPVRRDAPDHEGRRLAARLGLCGAFALNAMGFTLPSYLGMPDDFEFAGLFRLITFLSATLGMLVGGSYFIERAWRALRVKSIHIDLPIALGLITAYLGSIIGWILEFEALRYFDFVAIFVFLMLGGRYLQTAAVDRNRRRLLRASPLAASVISGETTLPMESITADTHYLIQPGQAVPVASVITQGEAEMSLEWINGEADPVVRRAGSQLPAGTILLSRQPLELRATEAWPQSLLAKLTAHSRNERPSPALQRILRSYLIIVLVLGVIGLLTWMLRGEPITGLQVMISIFVVSCPCALGIAVPLANDLAATRAERHGAFIRSLSLWPRLRNVRHVIFDKTGTLTLERPVLTNPEAVTNLNDEAAHALAQLTTNSLHPIGRSLLEAMGARGQKSLASQPTQQVDEFPGQGTAWSDPQGRRWTLGRAGWAGDSPDASTALCRDGQRIASFFFHDSLRPDAEQAINWLQARAYQLWILSGDTPEKVAQLAQPLGILTNQAIGGLSPTAKADKVKQIDHQDTLYLGDGANDSLAFDAAYVTGTPVVDRSLLEAKADFFTLGSGLDFLPALFRAADARARGVRAAFSFALLYNLIAITICFAGLMNPLLAAVLMPLSSIFSVILVAMHGKENDNA